MQAGNAGRDRLRAAVAYSSAALILYGAVGIAVQLRLLPLLAQLVKGWAGPPDPASALPVAGWLAPAEGFVNALPWLPLLVWLAGTALLASTRFVPHPEQPTVRAPGQAALVGRDRTGWLAAAVLVALLAIALYGRMAELWPQSYGISQFPYDDEGVYAGASQLFLQGILPYRDYFFAHPPVAAISYAPAMAYHFTAWGSPTSFILARYLSVAYSLVTLVLLFFIGRKLSGLWGGTLVGALWALDGRVVEINRKVMLDGPMVLLSCAALLIYLWARPVLAGEPDARGPRRPLIALALAGACATLSALTKIAGIACIVAILADLLWLAWETNRVPSRWRAAPRLRAQLGGLALGVALAAIPVLGPFLLVAPFQIVREVFFFQLLRPSDGLVAVPLRIADISSTLENGLTVLFAALGFLVLSAWIWRRGAPGPWRIVVLWAFFSLLLFTYSRSFYGHYYIQLAAPLCLLGAATSLLPDLLPRRVSFGLGWRVQADRWLPVLLVAVVALPLVIAEWRGFTNRHEDRIYEVVGRYVNDAVPPGTPVLSTDEQFNFQAARPPSRSPSTGYLVDSYGHMIYLGLGMNTATWGDLAGSLFGRHSANVYDVIHRASPQADFLSRVPQAGLVVIHDIGEPRLTPQTLETVRSSTSVAVRTSRYAIYRVNK